MYLPSYTEYKSNSGNEVLRIWTHLQCSVPAEGWHTLHEPAELFPHCFHNSRHYSGDKFFGNWEYLEINNSGKYLPFLLKITVTWTGLNWCEFQLVWVSYWHAEFLWHPGTAKTMPFWDCRVKLDSTEIIKLYYKVFINHPLKYIQL